MMHILSLWRQGTNPERWKKSEVQSWQMAANPDSVWCRKEETRNNQAQRKWGKSVFYDARVHRVCLTRYHLCECFHHNKEQDVRCYSPGEIARSFFLHLVLDH